MYIHYYGLIEKPFQINPAPKFLWLGEKHGEAFAHLQHGILNNQGLLLLTGDAGTGKTTLIYSLIETLSDDVIVCTAPIPPLKRAELFNFIARSLKLPEKIDNKIDFLENFRRLLITFFDKKQRLLLILDEAHKISMDVLEELHLILNIEIQDAKIINIFLVGNRDLNTILHKNDHRALVQRIAGTYNIVPLTQRETKEYVRYRLTVAGAGSEIFTATAIKKIYDFSGGYPRLINIVCDRALLTGFSRDLKMIKSTIIEECAKEISRHYETWHAVTRKTLFS